MNSNFEYYRIFYYVAKYGNLTKAAAALQTSQPAVTRTIHKLEDMLGCRLFVRSKSGMELTSEGNTFYQYISAGCAQFFKGEQNLSNLRTLDGGSITISATETALHCCLLQAMEAFSELHPKVTFRILNNSSRESVISLKQGQVDMAMINTVCHGGSVDRTYGAFLYRYFDWRYKVQPSERKDNFFAGIMSLSVGKLNDGDDYPELFEYIFCGAWASLCACDRAGYDRFDPACDRTQFGYWLFATGVCARSIGYGKRLSDTLSG